MKPNTFDTFRPPAEKFLKNLEVFFLRPNLHSVYYFKDFRKLLMDVYYDKEYLDRLIVKGIKSHTSSISDDHKHLRLWNLMIENSYELEEWDLLFESLDRVYSTYTKVTKLEINSCEINTIPTSILKFKNLETLIVGGARFWDLDMTHVPESVREVDFTDHSNLRKGCIRNIERLVNLEVLHLDFETFFGGPPSYLFSKYNEERPKEEDFISIPKLPKLRKVVFNSWCLYHSGSLASDWNELVKIHPLFSLQSISKVTIEFSVPLSISVILD